MIEDQGEDSEYSSWVKTTDNDLKFNNFFKTDGKRDAVSNSKLGKGS